MMDAGVNTNVERRRSSSSACARRLSGSSTRTRREDHTFFRKRGRAVLSQGLYRQGVARAAPVRRGGGPRPVARWTGARVGPGARPIDDEIEAAFIRENVESNRGRDRARARCLRASSRLCELRVSARARAVTAQTPPPGRTAPGAYVRVLGKRQHHGQRRRLTLRVPGLMWVCEMDAQGAA